MYAESELASSPPKHYRDLAERASQLILERTVREMLALQLLIVPIDDPRVDSEARDTRPGNYVCVCVCVYTVIRKLGKVLSHATFYL